MAGILVTWSAPDALVTAQPVDAGAEILISPNLERAIERSARRGGLDSILASLERVLADDTSFFLIPAKASELAKLSVRALAANDKYSPQDVGRISALFSSLAPDDQRSEVVAAVTNTMVMEVLALNQAPPLTAVGPTHSPDRVAASGPVAGADIPVAAAVFEPAPEAPDDQDRTAGSVPRYRGFLIYPDVIVSELYDSNIFATRNRTIDDFVTVVSPYILADSTWSRHLLRFESGADFGRYADNGGENYNDYWFSTEGRLDVGRSGNLFGGFRWGRYHEDRESPDDVLGIEPTKYNQLRAYAGTSASFGRLGTRISGTYRKLDFKAVPSPDGIISNDDRDRELYTGGARLTYNGPSGTRYYVQGAADIRRYINTPSDDDIARDSDGYRIIGGIAFEPSARLEAEVFGGYFKQDYVDPTLETVSGASFGADLDWTATERTSVVSFIERTVNETTISGAAAALSTSAGLRIEHQLAQYTEMGMGFDVGRSDFKGTTRRDNVVNANVYVKHYLGRYVFIEALYRFRHLHSTEILEDYDRNQALLRFGLQAYPTNPRRLSTRGIGSDSGLRSPFAGAYAGVQVGFGNLNTIVSGPRGSLNETVTSDFGGNGTVWGLFGGYGFAFSRLYLGAEFEGEATATEWTFVRGDAVRSFTVRKRLAYGGSARLGIILGEDILVYGRAGAVRTEFINRYQFGEIVLDDDITKTGLRLGFGAEFRVRDGLHLRLDYIFTGYSDYEINYESGIDTFDSDENALRAGVLFRF